MERLLAEMPWPVLNEWKAFDRIEPLDPGERTEWMLAQLTALSYNLWRSRNTQAAEIGDFIPQRVNRRKKAEEVWAQVRGWALSYKKDPHE